MSRVSKLKLLKVPLIKKDNNFTFSFDTYREQKNYYSDLAIAEYDDLSYVKGFYNKKIRIEAPIEDLETANYIMFQNTKYTDRWFYAYVTNYEYVSDFTTEIEFEVDYLQTFYIDVFGDVSSNIQGLVDRQMTLDDKISNVWNMYAEPDINITNHEINALDEVKISNWKVAIYYKPNLVVDSVVTALTYDGDKIKSTEDAYKYNTYLYQNKKENDSKETNDTIGGNPISVYGKLYSGCNVLFMPINNSTDVTNLQDKIWQMTTLGYNIVNIAMVNTELSTTSSEKQDVIPNITKNPVFTDRVVNGYMPVNNKCFMYPFTYLKVTNNEGTEKIFSYERFYGRYETESYNDRPMFSLIQALYGQYEMTVYPLGYKDAKYLGQTITIDNKDGFEYGLSKSGVNCLWNEDAFSKFLNKNVLPTLATAGAIGIGVLTGGIGGAVAKGAIGTLATKTAVSGASSILQGDESKNGNGSAGTLQIINDLFSFRFYQMTTSFEEMYNIDRFFSMYGYNWNNWKGKINIDGNLRYNYVKMNVCIINTEISIEAKEYIINRMLNGVTFWHDKENYLYGTFRGTDANTIIINEEQAKQFYEERRQ